MSFILDELRDASFRGVHFLVRNSKIDFSPGSIIHKYPNSKRIEVEYLGETPQSFELDMIVKGFADEYFSNRSALKKALLEQSNGLLLHPYEGNIKCAVVGIPELLEGDKQHGVAHFRVNFIRVDEKIYPTDTQDNSGIIDFIRDVLESANEEFISNSFAIATAEAYSFAQSSLGDIVSLYDDITDSITITDTEITAVKSTISTFNNNVLGFLNGTESLSNGIIGLANSLTGIGQDTSDQLNLWFTAFDNVPENPTYSVPTLSRIENLNNADAINNGIKIQTLANIYAYTPQITFNSTEEIDAYREQLEARYEQLTQIDESGTSISNSGISDPDVAYNLKLLRSETGDFLDVIEETVGDVVTIENVTPTTLTEFVFSRYGELSQYENIKALNSIQDPTNISGNLQIII